MTIDVGYSIAVIAVCALCTVFERAFPFLLFHGKVPSAISYLGKALPMAIMTALILYCLRNIDVTQAQSLWPQLLACIATVALHLWRRNALVSIFGGTIVCMLLTQFVFV